MSSKVCGLRIQILLVHALNAIRSGEYLPARDGPDLTRRLHALASAIQQYPSALDHFPTLLALLSHCPYLLILLAGQCADTVSAEPIFQILCSAADVALARYSSDPRVRVALLSSIIPLVHLSSSVQQIVSPNRASQVSYLEKGLFNIPT